MSKAPKEQFKSIEKLDLKNISDTSARAFQKVHCPSCQLGVVAENINLDKSIAKCSNCDVIFSIADDVGKILSKEESKSEFFRPEGIDLFFYKDDMEITVQEQTKGWEMLWVVCFLFLAGFCLAYFFKEGSNIALPIAGVGVLGMVYFIYEWITYSKYKTYIDINNKSLSYKSRPKNVKKDRTYEVEEIDQLYIQHSTDGLGLFNIQMIINSLEGQKHIKLITVNTLSKAKYLEQEIERYLNIEDRKVPEAHF